MVVFLERFALAVFATAFILVVFTNPMKLDTTQRIAGAIVLVTAAYFVGHTIHLSKQEVPKSAPQSSGPAKEDPRPTLSSMLESTFPNVMKLSGKPTLTFQDGTSLEIRDALYVDFNSGSKFLGFYVPSTPKSMGVMLKLPSDTRALGDELAKSLSVTARAPGENSQNIMGLTYTGRVYLYHEDELTHRQMADVEEAFRNQKLEVVLRGPDFLTPALLDWFKRHPDGRP